LLWAWTLVSSPAKAAESPGSFNLSEPAPGVFVHLGRHLSPDAPGHDDIANIGFIVGKACVAVIDTGGSVTTGRALRDAVRARTKLPICYVINTHVHFDHVLGNSAFKADRPSFVGSAGLAGAMKRSKDFFVSHYGSDLGAQPAEAGIVGPDQLVERELTVELGKRALRLRAWPAAHSDCDLTVEDIRTGTLWTGDLLFRKRLPAVDGSVKGWVAVIDSISHLHVNLAIPGHGDPSADLAAALAPERLYLQALMDGVRSELKQGKPMQAALVDVAVAERSDWLLWDDVQPRNVARVYQELEWE